MTPPARYVVFIFFFISIMYTDPSILGKPEFIMISGLINNIYSILQADAVSIKNVYTDRLQRLITATVNLVSAIVKVETDVPKAHVIAIVEDCVTTAITTSIHRDKNGFGRFFKPLWLLVKDDCGLDENINELLSHNLITPKVFMEFIYCLNCLKHALDYNQYQIYEDKFKRLLKLTILKTYDLDTLNNILSSVRQCSYDIVVKTFIVECITPFIRSIRAGGKPAVLVMSKDKDHVSQFILNNQQPTEYSFESIESLLKEIEALEETLATVNNKIASIKSIISDMGVK